METKLNINTITDSSIPVSKIEDATVGGVNLNINSAIAQLDAKHITIQIQKVDEEYVYSYQQGSEAGLLQPWIIVRAITLNCTFSVKDFETNSVSDNVVAAIDILSEHNYLQPGVGIKAYFKDYMWVIGILGGSVLYGIKKEKDILDLDYGYFIESFNNIPEGANERIRLHNVWLSPLEENINNYYNYGSPVIEFDLKNAKFNDNWEIVVSNATFIYDNCIINESSTSVTVWYDKIILTGERNSFLIHNRYTDTRINNIDIASTVWINNFNCKMIFGTGIQEQWDVSNVFAKSKDSHICSLYWDSQTSASIGAYIINSYLIRCEGAFKDSVGNYGFVTQPLHNLMINSEPCLNGSNNYIVMLDGDLLVRINGSFNIIKHPTQDVEGNYQVIS